MPPPLPPPSKGLLFELRNILQRGRQVWRMVARHDKLTLGGAAVLTAIEKGCNTAIAVLLGLLVTRMLQATKEGLSGPDLFRLAAIYLIFIGLSYLLRESLQVVRRYIVENTCTRIERDTSVALVSHLLKVDLTTISGEKLGSLHGRIHRSVDGFVKFLKLTFMDFFPAIANAAIAMTAALIAEPRLGIAMAGVVPISLFIVARQLNSQQGIRLALMRSKESMDGTVVEQLSGIEYIRAANTLGLEVERVTAVAEARRAKEFGHHVAMALFDCCKALNEGFFHILVISYAVYLAANGQIEFGAILTFSGLFTQIMTPLREMHRVIDDAHESSLQVGDLLGMFAEPVDRSFGQVTLREPNLGPEVPLLATENLVVDYRTSDGKVKRGLDGVTLSVRHGETIGAAGPSGSGKSTWLRALMRLTHPAGGRAFLGGIPLEALSRESIGKFIGYVGQNPFIFAGTVAENIAYGTPKATAEDIQRAAERACIHDEILAMPGGYQAAIAERGQNLSGGQRQRLALARIFLKNPPVLILDEGTSALDNISERNVQRAIAAARAERTVILVAHRLSTLRDADRILVFQAGKIVEVGTYDNLVKQGGVFTELVRSAEEHHHEARENGESAAMVASVPQG